MVCLQILWTIKDSTLFLLSAQWHKSKSNRTKLRHICCFNDTNVNQLQQTLNSIQTSKFTENGIERSLQYYGLLKIKLQSIWKSTSCWYNDTPTCEQRQNVQMSNTNYTIHTDYTIIILLYGIIRDAHFAARLPLVQYHGHCIDAEVRTTVGPPLGLDHTTKMLFRVRTPWNRTKSESNSITLHNYFGPLIFMKKGELEPGNTKSLLVKYV